MGKGTPNVMLPSTTGELVAVPSLDEVYLRKTREELVTWITDPQKIKPGTPMPTLVPAVVSPAEVRQIVDFLMGLNPAARPANSPKPN